MFIILAIMLGISACSQPAATESLHTLGYQPYFTNEEVYEEPEFLADCEYYEMEECF